MSLEKRTHVDQVEVRADGTLQIRLAQQIVEDGVVLSTAWHRSVLAPGADAGAHLAALNRHLAANRAAPVAAAEWQRVKAHAAAAAESAHDPA